MKIAVVGCGQIADAHIQEARRIPGVEVVAVCDLNVHMAEQAAARFGIPGKYTSLDEMLRDCRPDVVHVAGPPASHLPVGKSALEAGAHVYMEKPFTVNAREAEELVELATSVGRLVCVGHSMAFDSPVRRLRQLVEEGHLGDVVHIDATMSYNLAGAFGSAFMKDPQHWLHRLPGGVAQNNISHPLSMLLPFLTDEKPRIVARGFRLRPETYGDIRDRFHDELRVMLAGERVTAHVQFSCRARPVQLCLAVFGTKRQAAVSLDARTVQVVEAATLPGPFARIQLARRSLRQAKREYRGHLRRLLRAQLHFFDGMHELIRRFHLAIAGEAPMPVPMSEAVRTTAIMDEIFRQAAAGDEVGPATESRS